jgi:glutathione S-transferase
MRPNGGAKIMADLEIIGVAASNYVWAVRIACSEKRVPYKHVAVAPHSPEVAAIHPFGKIPVMRHGDVTLAESRAICNYIERMFDGPPLVPADPIKAAQVEQWVSLVNTSIDPVWVRQYLVGYVFPGTPDKSPNRPVIDAALPKMEKQFGVMDAAVQSGFLVGSSFTLADSNFMPILFYASRFPESRELLGKHRKLKAYFERHVARKSVQDTMPEKYAAELKAEQEAKAQAKAAPDTQGNPNEPSPASA